MKKLFMAILLALNTLPAFAAEIEQFPPGFRLTDGTHLNKLVDTVNSLTAGGTGGGYFTLNTGTGPTAQTGTVVQAVGANTATSRIELDSYAGVAIFSAIRRNGTKASPTAILSADQLGSFNYHGASTTSATYGPAARMAALATENWSSTAGGTKLVFSVTPNTTQTLTTALTVDQDQSVAVVGALTASGGKAVAFGVAAGYKIARGETALDGSNPTPVSTSLTTIVSCALSIKATSITTGTSVVSYDTSGSTMNMYGWKPTTTSTTTLTASTGTDTIGWVCVGT